MATFYEYDAQGWLVGWHEDPVRPLSTSAAPSMPPRQARWNGAAWTSDTSREVSDAGAATIQRRDAERAARLRAIQEDRAVSPEGLPLALLLADLCRAVPENARTTRMTTYLNAALAAGESP